MAFLPVLLYGLIQRIYWDNPRHVAHALAQAVVDGDDQTVRRLTTAAGLQAVRKLPVEERWLDKGTPTQLRIDPWFVIENTAPGWIIQSPRGDRVTLSFSLDVDNFMQFILTRQQHTWRVDQIEFNWQPLP